MKPFAPTRRAFLKATAGVTVALPLLDSLTARADSPYPKRLIILYTPNGVVTDKWFPTAGTSESDFTLADCHAPLAPYKNKLMILNGMDLTVCTTPVGSGGSIGEPHQKGMGSMLTGRPLLPGNFIGGDGQAAGWGSGQSVDQRIVQELAGQTRIPSLHLGVRSNRGLKEVRNRLSYYSSANPVDPVDDPRQAFDSLFQDFEVPPDDLTRLRLQRRSVLDTVKTQLTQVGSRLSAKDREKLEQHLTLVRTLEQNVTANPGGGQACTVPGQPPVAVVDDETTMEGIIHNQLDVLTAAMACDLTRVATLQISSAINHIRYPWVGSMEEGHNLSHAGSTNASARTQLITRHTWHAQQVAYILSRLQAIPEGSGTMLDNTVVWWCNELSVGNAHLQNSMPFVLAGGCGGFFNTGRYVQLPIGTPHNNLLVSLLNAFGIPDQTFGSAQFCTGPVTQLHA